MKGNPEDSFITRMHQEMLKEKPEDSFITQMHQEQEHNKLMQMITTKLEIIEQKAITIQQLIDNLFHATLGIVFLVVLMLGMIVAFLGMDSVVGLFLNCLGFGYNSFGVNVGGYVGVVILECMDALLVTLLVSAKI